MLELHQRPESGIHLVDPSAFNEENSVEALHHNAALAVEMTEAIVARQLNDPTSCDRLQDSLLIPREHKVSDAFWNLQQHLYAQGAFTQDCSQIRVYDRREAMTVPYPSNWPKDGEIFLFPESTEQIVEEASKVLQGRPAAMVFGSASMPVPEAADLGDYLGYNGFGCIVGGDGIHPENAMKTVLMATKKYLGAKTGIISTQYLMSRQGGNPNVDFTIAARNFRRRKEIMYGLGDFFPVLPGGMGTVDEVVTTIMFNLEAIQQGKLPKPIHLQNVEYWQPLMSWLDTMGLKDMVGLEQFR